MNQIQEEIAAALVQLSEKSLITEAVTAKKIRDNIKLQGKQKAAGSISKRSRLTSRNIYKTVTRRNANGIPCCIWYFAVYLIISSHNVQSLDLCRKVWHQVFMNWRNYLFPGKTLISFLQINLYIRVKTMQIIVYKHTSSMLTYTFILYNVFSSLSICKSYKAKDSALNKYAIINHHENDLQNSIILFWIILLTEIKISFARLFKGQHSKSGTTNFLTNKKADELKNSSTFLCYYEEGCIILMRQPL